MSTEKQYEIRTGETGKLIDQLSGKELANQGFEISLIKEYDGVLLSIDMIPTGGN